MRLRANTLPLEPDRTYSVIFSTASSCGEPQGQLRFSTFPKPGIRAVRHEEGPQGQLAVLTIFLTEPVANPSDIDKGSIFVSVKVDGFARSGAVSLGESAEEIFVSFKGFPDLPPSNSTLRVRVDGGLKFASGEVLPDDIEVAYIPDERPWGWTITGAGAPCPEESGCSASSAPSRGSAWALLGAGIIGIFVAVRRRTRTARPPV
jgi:MYXO-CTERM domain-containing protein